MTALGPAPGQVVVAASVGGTKVAAGAVGVGGEIVLSGDSSPTPRNSAEVYVTLADEVETIAARVGRGRVCGVGVSFPECVPPHPSFASGLPTPSVTHPVVENIERAIHERIGPRIPVAVLHDAAAAVLGEVSPRGTAPGVRDASFIVWGTGVASGVVRDGALCWRDAALGSMVSEAGALIVRDWDGAYRLRASSE